MSYFNKGIIVAALFISQVGFVAHAEASTYLTLGAFSGHPGDTTTVSGGGWTGNNPLSIYFSSTSGTPAATLQTAADGTFSTIVAIPSNAFQGPLSIIGLDAANEQSSNSFYVNPLTPSITTTAPSHSPFATVLVSGSGFASNEAVTISLAGTSTITHADATGSFVGASITVPSVSSGLYVVHAAGQLSGASSIDYLNYFWIDAFYPSISPATYYLLPGQVLGFNGSGFAPGETITVTTTGTTTVLSTFTADATGSFANKGGFAVPVAFHGSNHTFTLTGSLSHGTAATSVTVGDFFAYASPTSYYVFPTQSVAFNGGGFAAGETVNVTRTGTTTASASFIADTSGAFLNAGSVAVPADVAGGSIDFTLTGAQSGAQTTVSVGVGSFYPSITPSEYYVQGNSSIIISGTGFAPHEIVTLSTSGTSSVATTAANSLGAISGTVMIPFSSTGAATVTAKGNTSHAATSVGVTLATYYPTITPSQYYAFPGDVLSFTGSGFVPNETVTMTAGASSTTFHADAHGNFTTASTTVPFTKFASVTYSFIGAYSNNAVASTLALGTLSPYLSSDVYSANHGQTIHLSGSSFAAGEKVTVTAGSFSTTTTANSNGTTPNVSVPVPYDANNTLHAVFTGNSSGATAAIDISLNAFYPSLSADNYYATPGSTIHLNVSGFAPHETLTVVTGSSTSTATTDASGSNLSIPVTLPFSSANNSVAIKVSGVSSAVTVNLAIGLAPLSAQISPSTYYANPGSAVTFTGTGFAPNESVTVKVGGTTSTINASSTGSFTYIGTLPFKTATAHFVFTGSVSGAAIPLDITVAQLYSSITLSNYYAQGGTPLTISGSGFGGNEQVVFSTGSAFGTTTTDANGAFTYSGSVPFAPAGNATITATGALTGSVATSPITIAPVYTSFNLGSYASAPGTAITVMGSNYFPHEPITITTDRTGSTPVATFMTDASGNFNDSSFIIPSDFVQGNLVLTATSGHSFDSKSITFYVTGK